jgi:hypothetical protein
VAVANVVKTSAEALEAASSVATKAVEVRDKINTTTTAAAEEAVEEEEDLAGGTMTSRSETAMPPST